MRNSAIRLLGEVALRVNDLQKTQAFYTDVVGLEPWGRPIEGSFFRVADGVDVIRRCSPCSTGIPQSGKQARRSTTSHSSSI